MSRFRFSAKCPMHVPRCLPGASLGWSSCGSPAFGCWLLPQVKQTKLESVFVDCEVIRESHLCVCVLNSKHNLHPFPRLWLLREDVHPSQDIWAFGSVSWSFTAPRTWGEQSWAPTVCLCACTLSLMPSCSATCTTMQDNRGSVWRGGGRVWEGLVGHRATGRTKVPQQTTAHLSART